jgi:hypothetical protein
VAVWLNQTGAGEELAAAGDSIGKGIQEAYHFRMEGSFSQSGPQSSRSDLAMHPTGLGVQLLPWQQAARPSMKAHWPASQVTADSGALC